MARVFNYDVKVRRAAALAGGGATEAPAATPA